MPREQKGDIYLFRHILRGFLSSCWGVVSYTAGSSLQITEPDLFFQLRGHSLCSDSWMVCHAGSSITAALQAPTNCHKA